MSAILPVFVVVALILVFLAGYYVATVLPGSLPTTTTQLETSYVSTLTGNFTSAGVTPVLEHSQTPPYAIIYIVDGAYLDKGPAFNPSPTVISLANNGTVVWRNNDAYTNEIYATGCTGSSACQTNLFKSTNMTANFGSFTFKFNATGVYTYVSLQFPFENGTITVTA